MLAAGQLAREPAGQGFEPEPAQGFRHALFAFAGGQRVQAVTNVARHGEMGKQGEILRDKTHPAPPGRQEIFPIRREPAFAAKMNCPPVRSFESGQTAQKGGLASSGRSIDRLNRASR